MDPANSSLFTITLTAMGVSLILMVVIPVLPGQFLIWLAALIYGLLTGWEPFGLGMFVIISVLAIIASILDMVAGWAGAKRGGAGWAGIMWGAIVGLVGLIFFNALGALVGGIVGLLGYEYYRSEDWGQAWRAAKGYLWGLIASLIVRFVISVVMVGLFYWQAG